MASQVPRIPETLDAFLAEGNLINAAYVVVLDVLTAWRTSPSLDAVAARLADAEAQAERLGDDAARTEVMRITELVRRMRGPGPPETRDIDRLMRVGSDVILAEYLSFAGDWAG
jgi:hypothetical protein